MMISLQKSLNLLVSDSRLRQFMSHSLNHLALTSAEQMQIYPWTVTSFEVEFGEEIGAGGL
jgi:hypothetical protein